MRFFREDLTQCDGWVPYKKGEKTDKHREKLMDTQGEDAYTQFKEEDWKILPHTFRRNQPADCHFGMELLSFSTARWQRFVVKLPVCGTLLQQFKQTHISYIEGPTESRNSLNSGYYQVYNT